MPVVYVRTVKTASGATAVQIVHSNRRGSREIEHIGSTHSAGCGGEDRRPAAAARQPGPLGPRRSARRRRGADRVESGPASVGGAEHRLPGAGNRPGLWRRGVRVVNPGLGDRADEQAGLDPGVDRGRDRRTELSHDQAAAAGLCDTAVARCPRISVRDRMSAWGRRGTAGPRPARRRPAHRNASGPSPLRTSCRRSTVVADAGMLSESNLAALEDARLGFIVGAGSPMSPTKSPSGGSIPVSRSATGRS